MAKRKTGDASLGDNGGDANGDIIVENGSGDPNNDDASNVIDFDPATISGSIGDSAGDGGSGGASSKRKTGRKRGRKAQEESADDLSFVLLSCHAMLATITGTPELELEEKESKKLAAAIARVQSLYTTSFLSEEQLAWTNLIFVAGSVYGTRAMAIRLRKRSEKAKPVQVITSHGPTA